MKVRLIRDIFTSQSKQKAVKYLNKAMKIAKNNPGTHNIQEVYGHRNYVNIIRNCGGTSRLTTYNKITGRLMGISRYPHGDNAVVNYKCNGHFNIRDFISNSGEYFDKSFKNFTDFINYFRKELPIINRK